jgi:hypothetical protein
MSNARRSRRAVQRHAITAKLAKARRQPARFVRTLGPDEIWARGRVLFVVPGTPEGAPPLIREGTTRRRLAALHGECPCGGSSSHPRAVLDAIHRLTFLHEADCPASDDVLVPALRAWRESAA